MLNYSDLKNNKGSVIANDLQGVKQSVAAGTNKYRERENESCSC